MLWVGVGHFGSHFSQMDVNIMRFWTGREIERPIVSFVEQFQIILCWFYGWEHGSTGIPKDYPTIPWRGTHHDQRSGPAVARLSRFFLLKMLWNYLELPAAHEPKRDGQSNSQSSGDSKAQILLLKHLV